MAVDWSDQTQVQQFRQHLIDQGEDPSSVDSYIGQKAGPSQSASPTSTSDVSANPAPVATPDITQTPQLNQTDPLASPTVGSGTPESFTPVAPMMKPPKQDPSSPGTPTGTPSATPAMPETPSIPQITQAPMKSMAPPMSQGPIPPPPVPHTMASPMTPQSPPVQGQGAMIPFQAHMTQPFGNHSGVEKYSGGVNLGADFAVPPGTPLSAPPGQWKVVKAQPGFNGGSGNFVKIQNTQTGESIGYEHLTKIGVQPGQIVNGGQVGLSGGNQQGPGRGNSTGAHASLPYQDAKGRYQDIMRSPYARYMFGR